YSTGQKRTSTIVATPPVHSTTSSTVPPEPSTTSATTSTTTGTKPPPPPPPPKRAGVGSWPAGKTGYTVVLTSVPAGGGRAAAVAQARRALAAGLTRVGVLDSS